MKKVITLLLAVMMVLAVIGCKGREPAVTGYNGGGNVINVWSFTDEIPNAVLRFKEMNPSFPYDFNITIIPTTEGAYQPALDQALVAGGNAAPDIFTAEQAFVLKYTQGELARFAMPYKDLGINVDAGIRDAQIATYTHQIGTRPSDNNVVALAFQNTGSGLIYRRSIAKEVFGTDDPTEIGNIVGPGWDKYLEAAAQLREKGYSIASGEGDIWQVMRNNAERGYVQNGRLYLDPAREAFLDVAKALFDNDYTNRSGAWSDPWFADMSGSGLRPVFGFLGPAWLINYVMINNVKDTFGDWAVANPPVPFSWGGTWVIANQGGNLDVKDGVKQLIEWITLDTSNTGFQYLFANGNLFEGSAAFPDQAAAYAAGNFAKDAVASGVVMAKSDGSLAMLGGQNMYDIFIPAGANTRGDFFSPYDETISQHFNDQVQQYLIGEKTREQAIADWRSNVTDILPIRP